MGDTYFHFFPKQEETINKSFGVTEKDMKEMLGIVKSWMIQEPHIPRVPEDSILQDYFDSKIKYMLRVNKLSIEKLKKKIDMYFSFMDLYPEIFEDREPLKPKMVEAMDTYTFIPLPKPLDAFTRVIFYQLNDPDVDKFKIESFIAMALNLLDMRSNYDLCFSEHYVLDYHNYTVGHVSKLSLPVLIKIYNIIENGLSDKISGIHFINVPPIAQNLISLAKMLINQKISSRIYVHNDMDSLFKIIPRKIIPSDLGGDEEPLSKLRDDWRTFVESKNDWFIENCKMKANNDLKIEKIDIKNNMFGSEGSFRSLSID